MRTAAGAPVSPPGHARSAPTNTGSPGLLCTPGGVRKMVTTNLSAQLDFVDLALY